MSWTRKDAEEYAHEDLAESRQYRFEVDGREWTGNEIKTACGHWFSACEDDPVNYSLARWRFKRDDGRPTCPKCVEKNPCGYPGMLLVVRGPLGIPQIVRVTGDGEWLGVVGIGRGRVVATNKQVLHVCQEGDVFEDLELVVQGGELVAIQ